jgi:hypothetical protein
LKALALALSLGACGGAEERAPNASPPYPGDPPQGTAILVTEGEAILDGAGADTGWRWILFDDAFCNTATVVGGGDYQFGTATTGLAINWGDPTSTDLVVFLQGGGACWDFVTCGGAHRIDSRLTPTAATGPFGAAEFAANVYERYPNAWVRRANLPPSLAAATIVFVPYCTGDVHAGQRVTTYSPPSYLSYLPAITWHHVGHGNLMAFLARLKPTFPSPGKLVVAGSSAGGFGTLANYPAFRWYWPDARSYLVDDSAPPLIGGAIPATTRSAWYSSWNLGESIGRYCPECPADMSRGLAELASRYPDDRIALICHLQDEVIRFFYGTFLPVPVAKDAAVFEAELRALGTNVLDPATPNARYFFTNTPTPVAHPALEDPTQVTTPGTGLTPWLEAMFSDSTTWGSATD